MLPAVRDLFGGLWSAAPRSKPARPPRGARAPKTAPPPSPQLEFVVPVAADAPAAVDEPALLPLDAADAPPPATPEMAEGAPGPALTEGNAQALLDALTAHGLAGITTLTLTRNRTVMVSWKGAHLRVHHGFVGAPEEVLRAIVRFVTARRRGDRAAAVRVLRTFELPERPAAVRRRIRTLPEDQPLARRLMELHRAYNRQHFGGALLPIEIVVSRRMSTRLGHYALAHPGQPGQIAISRRHLRRHGWEQAAETLLHEMVHQWQDESGLPVDHGRAFRRKAREVGITPSAKRAI